MSYQAYGDEGEKEVARLVLCPNCSKQLMTLPKGYPLFDIQCSACSLRAQIKSSSSNPNKSFVVRGAGWDIMEKVIKSGFLIPPLIVNYKWFEKGEAKQEIRFYPFVLRKNLVTRVANVGDGKRLYNMFDYNLKELVYFKLYSSI